MKETYETSKMEKIEVDNANVILASGVEVSKNPGHSGCTVMPNGKPLPNTTKKGRTC